MNLAVIGSGGREHSICYKLKKSQKVKKLICIPGNAGTKGIAENIDANIHDFNQILEIIKSQIGYDGKIIWDKNMPIGPNRRNVSIDLAREKIDYNPKVSLDVGIKKTIDWYLKSKNL